MIVPMLVKRCDRAFVHADEPACQPDSMCFAAARKAMEHASSEMAMHAAGKIR
jgi:hypothetical protein